MNSFTDELNQRLAALRKQGLQRELRRIASPQGPRVEIGGKIFLNFSSNDYLGLANDTILKEAAIEAVKQFGAGAGASRLVCGSLAPFHELEESLAAFKKTGAALTFSTGYAAAIGTICALLGKDDIIVMDKLVHACIVDAARLSGAKLRIFSHNDLNELEDILKWAGRNSKADAGRRKANILVVTESIFSMDGDAAPLRETVALKEKYGAWLMVDEAHATGIIGKGGRGLADKLGVGSQIEIQMGTLGKALGSSGGYICGSRVLIDFLVNRARSFIFSTAPVPAGAAAAAAAIKFIQSKPGDVRRNLLWRRVKQFNSKLKIQNPKLRGAILPILIGDETKTVEVAANLQKKNIFIPAIRYPTVARGQARLRVTLTAAHPAADVKQLANALTDLKSEIPDLKSP
jgi:8-amino-7-oxononanoate synthase